MSEFTVKNDPKYLDLIGTKNHHLTVKEYVGHKNQRAYYRLECDCEEKTKIIIRREHIKSRKSCGCQNRAQFKCGDIFNSLVVLKFFGIGKSNDALWDCQCFECNIPMLCSSRDLISGRVKSCGKCSRSKASYQGIEDLSMSYFNQVKKSAEEREIDFLITIEEAYDLWLLQKGKCALSNIELHLSKTYYKDRHLQNASLDRKDSDKPYSKENCQWLDQDLNYMKNDMDESKFIWKCSEVTDFQRKLKNEFVTTDGFNEEYW